MKLSNKFLSGSVAAGLVLVCGGESRAADWPEWGGTPEKNMVSDEVGMPVAMSAGDRIKDSDDIDPASAENCKWVVKLGSEAYGTATILDGKVIVGTNNESPRVESVKGDRGIVMCFDEETGDLLWQLSTPKLGAGKVSDWEYLGMCSSTLQEGKYAYVITNRGEVLCLDREGLADGNDGPFEDEAKYKGGGLSGISDGTAEEVPLVDEDADIVWGFDMATELGVFPHNVTSSSVVAADGIIYASTSNGVDYSHKEIPVPNAPCLIALDQKTGELLGEEGSGIGNNIMHCNWSSPTVADGLVYFGGGDGYLYAYEPNAVPGTGEWDGLDVLPEVWKVDGNAPEYRKDENGEPIKYATYDGASEFISTPVYHDGKIYAAIGQDPEHGEGVGRLSCVDAKTGETIWEYKDINRTISTPSIWNNLLWIADYSGQVHCLDATTGEVQWIYDTLSHIWGSTLVADGKVYIGNEDAELVILKADAGTEGEAEELGVVQFHSPVFSSAVAANGVLYIQTQNHLYAFEQGE